MRSFAIGFDVILTESVLDFIRLWKVLCVIYTCAVIYKEMKWIFKKKLDKKKIHNIHVVASVWQLYPIFVIALCIR